MPITVRTRIRPRTGQDYTGDHPETCEIEATAATYTAAVAALEIPEGWIALGYSSESSTS